MVARRRACANISAGGRGDTGAAVASSSTVEDADGGQLVLEDLALAGSTGCMLRAAARGWVRRVDQQQAAT